MIHDLLVAVGYSVPAGGGQWPFVLLTLALGGGAAWRTGQAVAQGWNALWPVIAYTALIAAAVRFLHFSLFGATLLSLQSFLVDFSVLAIVSLAGHRVRRARHMTEQYEWMFARSSPFTWRERR